MELSEAENCLSVCITFYHGGMLMFLHLNICSDDDDGCQLSHGAAR